MGNKFQNNKYLQLMYNDVHERVRIIFCRIHLRKNRHYAKTS